MAYFVKHRNRIPDPFQLMERELSRLFDEPLACGQGFYPQLNVHASDQEVVVDALTPGIEPDQMDIEVHQNELTIQVKRPEETLEEGAVRHQAERGTGNFSRRIRLPFEVDADRVDAKSSAGILRITLPRSEKSRPRKVQIKIDK